jgi:hypothetical protein
MPCGFRSMTSTTMMSARSAGSRPRHPLPDEPGSR